jgi:hypothetical protein
VRDALWVVALIVVAVVFYMGGQYAGRNEPIPPNQMAYDVERGAWVRKDAGDPTWLK